LIKLKGEHVTSRVIQLWCKQRKMARSIIGLRWSQPE